MIPVEIKALKLISLHSLENALFSTYNDRTATITNFRITNSRDLLSIFFSKAHMEPKVLTDQVIRIVIVPQKNQSSKKGADVTTLF